jgi:hypothetical protein
MAPGAASSPKPGETRLNEHKHVWSSAQVGELRDAIEAKLPDLLNEALRLEVAMSARRRTLGPGDLVAVYLVGALLNERFEYARCGETMCDECLFELVKELRRQVWIACPFEGHAIF